MAFKILNVAQQNGVTAVQIEALPDTADAGSSILGRAYVHDVDLIDDLGNHYAMHEQNMPGVIGGPTTSFELTRSAPKHTAPSCASFALIWTIPPPCHLNWISGGIPQPDQTWDLKGKPGSEYQINGYTIALLSARYAKEHESASYFSPVDRDVYTLEFTARVTPPTADYTPTSCKAGDWQLQLHKHGFTGGWNAPDEDLLREAIDGPTSERSDRVAGGHSGRALENSVEPAKIKSKPFPEYIKSR